MDLTAATNELLVGAFVLPLVLAVIMQADWSEAVRALVFAVACILTGVLLHATDLHDRASLSESIVLVLVSAGTLYKSFWKPSGVAPAIEIATTVNPKVRANAREAREIRASHRRNLAA